jgi:adenylate cyclase
MFPDMAHEALTGEIESWLLDETLHDPDIIRLFEALCLRLNAAGIPLERGSVNWPTLHPLFRAEQIYWHRGEAVQHFQTLHAEGFSEAFLSSPFYHAMTNNLPRLRRRLEGPEALADFPVLVEFRDKGFTDYLLTSTDFHIARVKSVLGREVGIMASWATRRPGGFSDADIVALTRIQKAFAVACHGSIQKRVMESLADTFVGPTAARRILAGETRLGDGDEIRAVVWYADLRGSTWLSSNMPAADYLAYLRDYYACTADSAIAEGGEVLDFIGDAVLAIFPVRGDLGGPEAVQAATRATEAALDRLAAYRAREGVRDMQFSISLAMGPMMYGNIGVASRLSFSAIGPAVNAVTRIDDLSKSLGRAVLVTADIAAVEPERWVAIGEHRLVDVDEPVRLFARADGRDRFDNAHLRDRLARPLAAA